MSTIQTRNKMDDKIHQNQFYFVANAQLFDSSVSNEISPMSNTLVAIGADTQLGYSCVSAPLATNVDLWNPIGFT